MSAPAPLPLISDIKGATDAARAAFEEVVRTRVSPALAEAIGLPDGSQLNVDIVNVHVNDARDRGYADAHMHGGTKLVRVVVYLEQARYLEYVTTRFGRGFGGVFGGLRGPALANRLAS